MSHYKPYPAYKDSGVKWLGRVPGHWQQLPIKRLVRSIEQGWSPECESWPAIGEEWGVLKVGCVNGGSFRPDENKALPATLEPRPELAVCKGDVLVSRANTRELVGSCVAVPQDYPSLLLCDKIYRIRAGERVTPEFLAALITVHGRRAVEIEATGASSSMLNISQSVILDLPVALPEPAEQNQIMAAATRETTRIDALVDKKTRFMELLREKRQALITHAVTKGLDPSVKMKDSGVEWLGEVPEDWSVTPLKYIGSSIIGLTYSPENVVDEGDGTLVLRSSNIQNGQISLDDNVYVSAVIPAHLRTRIGDILICSRNGSRSLIGKNGLIDSKSEGLTFGAFTTVFRTPHHKFLYYVLNSSLFKFQAGRFLTTTINQLTTETLNSFEIPLPPAEQQASITKHLDRQTTRLDTLIQKTQHSIDLLKERRAALITAAVTGQIDLRQAA